MVTRTYIGIAERGAQNWGISFPSFPGVISIGDSLPEVIAHGRDALASAVDVMQEDGQLIPADYTADPNAAEYDRSHYQDPHLVLLSVEVGATWPGPLPAA